MFFWCLKGFMVVSKWLGASMMALLNCRPMVVGCRNLIGLLGTGGMVFFHYLEKNLQTRQKTHAI